MPKQIASVATDDYLTTIYRLQHDEQLSVIAIRLSERLRITPPSVAGMIKRLQRDGLITIDRGKTIHLTPAGLSRAEQMIRRHRLAECLLTNVLKIPWWRAYEEAHLFEHGISEVTEQPLFEALGKPTHSPFGYPIPGSKPLATPSAKTAADLPEGSSASIDRVFEEDEALLKFFDEEGIHPGSRVKVESHSPARGTVTLLIDDHAVVMGTPVASRIWVR